MVLEGILTTRNANGEMHASPIGPHVNRELTKWQLKPFQTSTTFANLRRESQAVFHVTDNALLLARSVLGQADMVSATETEFGFVLHECCHWFQLEITEWDISEPRANAACRLVSEASIRRFWGWNRAMHAVLEAAIIASRKSLLSPEDITADLQRLQTWVSKTGGKQEKQAFELLRSFLESDDEK